MRMNCRLYEKMQDPFMTVDELHRRARVGRDVISNLRWNKRTRFDPDGIARICGVVNVTLDQLFVLVPEDSLAPIRLSRGVAIHLGSRPFQRARVATGRPQESLLSLQGIAARDHRAAQWISEHLLKLDPRIVIRMQEHMTGFGYGFDPSMADVTRHIFERGNHVLIGSPIANPYTEYVVCHMYDVPPYVPRKREAFPYGFVWDSERSVPSSFGWQGEGPRFGIYSTKKRDLVAFRTVVPEGDGEDCAIIVTYRVFQPPAARTNGADDERIIICILGDGGPGTEAAARVATDPQYAAALYPPTRGVPHMRVVGARYTRVATPDGRDNRVVTDVYLVDDDAEPHPRPATPPPAPEPRPRRKPARTPTAKRARARWRMKQERSLALLRGGGRRS